jgi:cyclopropane fatty-acyl-phospholipid synthase-like methyltransferase
MKEQVKEFWSDRAKKVDVVRSESQVNFISDAETAQLYINSETDVINRELSLKKSDIVVDLGAGNGRWSLLLAPKVEQVVAVEFIEKFTKAIEAQAEERGLVNVEVVNLSSEEFVRDNFADVLFVSGLLNNLDENQYNKTIDNITRTIKKGGILFMRETISILDDEYIVDRFSEELGTHYWSYYRTAAQHIEALTKNGFTLHKYAPFFEDGSILNKRLETRLHYFIFSI